MCSSTLCASSKNDQQRLPQTSVHRVEAASSTQLSQARQRAPLRRAECQEILPYALLR